MHLSDVKGRPSQGRPQCNSTQGRPQCNRTADAAGAPPMHRARTTTPRPSRPRRAPPLVVQQPPLGALGEPPPVALKRRRHPVSPQVRLRAADSGGGAAAAAVAAAASGPVEPLGFEAPAHELEPGPDRAWRAALLVARPQVPDAAAARGRHAQGQGRAQEPTGALSAAVNPGLSRWPSGTFAANPCRRPHHDAQPAAHLWPSARCISRLASRPVMSAS